MHADFVLSAYLKVFSIVTIAIYSRKWFDCIMIIVLEFLALLA
jgi:hypothetical protein